MYILAGCYKDFAFKFLMVVGAVFSLWKSKQVSIAFSFSDGNIKYLGSVNCIQLSSLQTQFLLPRVWPVESSIAAHCVCTLCAKSLQSCLTLCYPVDCSPPGSSVSGILQARILEWVTTNCRGSLKWQMLTSSQFWKLKVRNRGAGRIGSYWEVLQESLFQASFRSFWRLLAILGVSCRVDIALQPLPLSSHGLVCVCAQISLFSKNIRLWIRAP